MANINDIKTPTERKADFIEYILRKHECKNVREHAERKLFSEEKKVRYVKFIER